MFKRSLAVFFLIIYSGAFGAQFPVKISAANPRLLVDAGNAPFLLVGDAPQSLLVNLNLADTAYYLADRGANGFNTLWVNLLCVQYTAGRANGSLLNGTLPFTKTLSNGEFDLSAPNEAYFSYVDTVIKMAATNGIQILLDPLETGGLLQTALDNGSNQCRAYGQYLGNRYKNFPNIIWLSGNDFQNWSTPANDAVITAIALGIKDNDTNHLQTAELDYLVSTTLNDSNWKPIVGLNLAYTYYPTYDEILHGYQQTPTMPVFLGEEHYEFETIGESVAEYGTPLVLRYQEYWTMLSGGVGQIYGNSYIWQFLSGWKSFLDSTGVAQLRLGTGLFSSRAWYNLVPDVGHTFLTAGYGTYATGGLTSSSDYCTAAKTADGTLGMAYLPTIRTVTVNLAAMSGAVTAQWFDPANGNYSTISGSPFANTGTHTFTPAGNNSAGDPDWVLVLGIVATPLQILTGSLPSATTGAAYSSQILASGGSPPYSWSLASSSPSLPASLSFSTSGVLSGLPTIGGIFTLIVQVLDSTNALTTKNFAILISAPDTTTTAPVAAYSFNEGGGMLTTDASGNGGTGTINAATWTTAGKYGKALAFNGTSSYVNLGNPASLKLTGSMTLEAWVLATGNPADDGQIIAKSDSYSPLVGWQFKTTPDTGVRTFGIGVSPDGSAITQRYSKTVLVLNTWYHVAGVYNASAQTLDIYVNGVLDDGVLDGTVPSVQFDPNTNVTVGKRSSGFNFKGTIDEVRVYNRALTQAQIQNDLNTAIVP